MQYLRAMYTNKNYRFINWARNVRSRPEVYFLPENEDDVITIVKQAFADNKKIRVVGAGHSWSGVAATDSYMVSLDKLNRIVHIDYDTMRVTVQGGIRLKHLHPLLYAEGLAMQNLGSISEQSIVGAISTGTHGTGISYGILATQVVKLRMINGKGEVVELTEDDGDIFKAAAVSLGCMGIITQVTLQCERVYHVHEDAQPVLFNDVTENLPEWVNTAQHLKLWWFPHTKHIMVYRYTKVYDEVKDTFVKQYIDDGIVSKLFFRLFLSVGHINKSLRPKVNKFIGLIFLKKINRVNKNHKIYNVPMPPLHRETEYAFPVDKAAEVLARLQILIEEKNLRMNFVVEVRFTKADDFLLSACNGQNTCYIGFYLAGNKNWQAYLTLFEELAKEYNARPHLGKEFLVDAGYLKQIMPGLSRFNEIRKQFDPKGIFENKFTQKLFQ